MPRFPKGGDVKPKCLQGVFVIQVLLRHGNMNKKITFFSAFFVLSYELTIMLIMTTSMSRNLMATSPCQLPACTVENRPEPILSPSLKIGGCENYFDGSGGEVKVGLVIDVGVYDDVPELLVGNVPLPDRHLPPRTPSAQTIALDRGC